MARHTVLLVNQFPDERTLYAESLRGFGYEVRIAEGPEHALAIAIGEPPAIVVTRILQPGHTLDGLDLLRALKTSEQTRDIPVLIITSLIPPEYRQQAYDAGCDGYVLLPALPQELANEIRKILASTERHRPRDAASGAR